MKKIHLLLSGMVLCLSSPMMIANACVTDNDCLIQVGPFTYCDHSVQGGACMKCHRPGTECMNDKECCSNKCDKDNHCVKK